MTGSAPEDIPGRILLVEDDAVTAHFMVHVLGARGGGIEVVRQQSITAGHLPTVPATPTLPEARGVSVTTSHRSGSTMGVTSREAEHMASDRPDPGEFLEMAQRMLRELFGGSSGHDDDPWGEATRRDRESFSGGSFSREAHREPSACRPAPRSSLV